MMPVGTACATGIAKMASDQRSGLLRTMILMLTKLRRKAGGLTHTM